MELEKRVEQLEEKIQQLESQNNVRSLLLAVGVLLAALIGLWR